MSFLYLWEAAAIVGVVWLAAALLHRIWQLVVGIHGYILAPLFGVGTCNLASLGSWAGGAVL